MRIPPPVAALAAAVLQHVTSWKRPMTKGSRRCATAIGIASSTMLAGAALRFVTAGTSLDPHRVESASTLVVDGWHRFSRNPMYVGFAGLLVAHAIARRSLAALVPAAAFVTYLDRVQIPAEESALRDKFGDAYEQYVRDVPRWVDARSLRRRG